MLSDIQLHSVLFVDIETVPSQAAYEEMPLHFRELWEKKSSYFRKENESAEDVFQRAGIYAEFGKIICVSVGYLYLDGQNRTIRIKSFFGDDEEKLLIRFSDLLNNYSKKNKLSLCGHNGKEFDFPYLARRMLINGIKLPKVLDMAGKKPWEVSFIDTMDLWKFGDYKHFTSLDLLTRGFGIPTPKDQMDGSMVADVYYKDHNIKAIVEYCERDVVAVIQLILKFRGEEIIPPEKIESATQFEE